MILKVGEGTYAKSLAGFHSSYEEGFPQRQQYFFSKWKKMGIPFEFFEHPPLDTFAHIALNASLLQHKIMSQKDSRNGMYVDTIIVDNPFSALILREIEHIIEDQEVEIIFDYIDQYEAMFETEFGKGNFRLHLMRVGMQWLHEHANKVVFQSPLLRKEEGGKFWDDSEQIAIPNGYEDVFLEECRVVPTKLQAELNVPNVKYKIGFAGKLGAWYRELMTVSEAVEGIDGAHLFVAGDGPDRDQYDRFKKTHILGRLPLDQVAALINMVDVLVFPVDDDSPIATTEYLTTDKPIVHYGNRIEWLLGPERVGVCYVSSTSDPSYRLRDWTRAIEKAIVDKQRDMSHDPDIKKLSWTELSKEFVRFGEEGE